MTTSGSDTNELSYKREEKLIRVLMAFVATGLFFMLLPGTLLGVVNLFSISSDATTSSISPAWIQAHGQAQLFGWVGSFILGLGFYSIPFIRRISSYSYKEEWIAWSLYTTGVFLRWYVGVYNSGWRVILPLSTLFELMAVIIFLVKSRQGHKKEVDTKHKLPIWVQLVLFGTIGQFITFALNFGQSVNLAINSKSVVYPEYFDIRFLTLAIWGFILPIAWGFSAHWLSIILKLKPINEKLIYTGLLFNLTGLICLGLPSLLISSICFIFAAIFIILGLRLFESNQGKPQTNGIIASFPLFVKISYVWLVISAILSIISALYPETLGIGGSSRHAVTVGFMCNLIFCVAPRMLPAFLGRSKIFSIGLMLVSLMLINLGCALRVSTEILAYNNYLPLAWKILPVSAVIELTAIVIFFTNMGLTMLQKPIQNEILKTQTN